MSTLTPTSSTLPATSSTVLPAMECHSCINPLPTQISSLSPIPTTQFYHDPVLFEQIIHLESAMEQMSGQVKMV